MSQEPRSRTQQFHPVTHVIFDCDGLLVDSEVYYYEALAIVAKRYGKEFTFKIKAEMMGKSTTKVYLRRDYVIDSHRQPKLTPHQQVQNPSRALSYVWIV